MLNLLLGLVLTAAAEDFTYNQATGTAIPKHVGELKLVKGVVLKVNGDQEVPVGVGTKFYQSDELKTENKSFAQLHIFDGSKINLGPNSQVKLEHFDFSNKDQQIAVYDFVKGQLRALIKKAAKPADVKFKTPVAVMGVRGTELLINHQNLQGVAVSQLALVGGKVQVTGKDGQVYELGALDRVTVVHDPQRDIAASEPDQLGSDLAKELKQEETFMPLMELQGLPQGSKIHELLSRNAASATHEADQSKHSILKTSQPSTSDNLKKLNQQLEEEHRKKIKR